MVANSSLTDVDRELLRHLLEDSDLIIEEIRMKKLNSARVRSTFSPMLRKWVSNNDIFKAIKIVGSSCFKFNVISHPVMIEQCKNSNIDEWFEGCHVGNVGFSHLKLNEKFKLQNPNMVLYLGENFSSNDREVLDAKSFINQNMVFWKEKFFDRQRIVRFFADTQGGTHYDFNDQKTNSLLIDIRDSIALDFSEAGEPGGKINIYFRMSLSSARNDPTRRPFLHDALQIVLIDTAQALAIAVSNARQDIEHVLSTGSIS